MNTTRIFDTVPIARDAVNLYTGNGRLKGVRSMAFIAAKYNTTVESVRRILTLNGVAIRGRGRVAQNA